MFFRALLTFFTVVAFAALSNAALSTLQQITDFGSNPTNIGMFVYRPLYTLGTSPPLVVAIHYCGGTAEAYFNGTQYASLADQYGFIIIYPNAPAGCWDVHTNETLTHDAGGDSLGIASMVRYAIASYNVDPNRVFMTGTSSGAMMTNVLAGAYPDLFKAGSAFAGVPYGCFAGPDMWNTACATGTVIKTAEEWGDLVRNGYPGYTGARPKLQIWQGTLDTTLNYNDNFAEGIKQWTNVFGYSTTPVSTTQDSPLPGWSRSTYGPNFQAIIADGVDHNIPVQANDVLTWFGIIPPVTTAPPSSTTTAPWPQQTHYGQCGGIGWSGVTSCAPPYTCQFSNPWFSHCL